jgi:hypothetical protein
MKATEHIAEKKPEVKAAPRSEPKGEDPVISGDVREAVIEQLDILESQSLTSDQQVPVDKIRKLCTPVTEPFSKSK